MFLHHRPERLGLAIITLHLMASSAGGAMGCGRPTRNNHDAASPEPTVILTRDSGAPVRVKVQLARTPEERQTGLMYRSKLETGTGMLFIFDQPEVQSFWMHNTLIPLDMIFIGGDLRVVGIIEKAEPLTLTPRTVGEKSQYVLEVEGGFSATYGIKKGSQVQFRGFDVSNQGGKP
jgi:uncharacterized protein